MKKIENHEQLNNYLKEYQLESIFNKSLIEHLALYSFEQGEDICSQGDTSQYLYILVKGKIKIFTSSSEGRKLILSFKTPLYLIGDIEYVQDIDIINTVEAVSPVIMIGIQYQWLKKFGSEYTPLLRFLLETVTRKFYIKSNFLSFNLLYPVEVRLASYLLSISFYDSDANNDSGLSINRLRDVADLIGTSYRHLNRVIQQLCAEGLIERTKESIIVINRDALSTLANHNIYE
ncbi:cyclic nucleotide-binding domain-containing protein [Viridibacillus sp. FSL E2-0187]|uniref:Crp/Fnr family transcriptional regulator n=1 Tax=Viridibacillus sp. FSL E2-0187 TaxID=2921362 RepID=UPI0030FB4149